MKPHQYISIAALPVGHEVMANARALVMRALVMDVVEEAKSGHPGMPMGMPGVATVLFTRFLKFDAAHPERPNRERFVLSAGHGSMLLYALLCLSGYEGVGLDELKCFRRIGSKTAGHPEYGHCPGIETTTGPLGQGIATAVGMAITERMLNARFGDPLVDHGTYVLAGDGRLMEGLSREAIDLAGRLWLGRLIVLLDDNGISIDGPTSIATSLDQLGGASLLPVGRYIASTAVTPMRSPTPPQRRAGRTGLPSSPAARSSATARPRSRVPRTCTARHSATACRPSTSTNMEQGLAIMEATWSAHGGGKEHGNG